MLGLILALLTGGSRPAAPHPDSTAYYMSRGVSRELAEHRARALGEVRYDLALDVTATDSAPGSVSVRFRRGEDADVLLDFRGRRLVSATVNDRPLPPSAWNGAHIQVPAAMLRTGENDIEIAFVADIAPSGASIIRFHDPSD